MTTTEAKAIGSYYTPASVAHSLVRWAVRRGSDRLLDPSCGDGQFLALHSNAVGVEQDPQAAIAASHRAVGSVVHVEDFFSYANATKERFDCAVGNPPFIRYQRFAGETRRRALQFCSRVGANFSALSSSWAPFIVAAASLLKPGGRVAFVVPAEIGHAPYATPLIKYLMGAFGSIRLIAIRDTVFPKLSQDVWLLFAGEYGESTDAIELTTWDTYRPLSRLPRHYTSVTRAEWLQWNCRLRSFLLSDTTRQLYQDVACQGGAYRLGNVARVGIGYVTGANEFFHLRPSTAESAEIPKRFLAPTIRSGRNLPPTAVSRSTLAKWIRSDAACLLLRLRPEDVLPNSILRYLDSEEGLQARSSYKCSHRTPWYSVPDVVFPDGFLSYMSGDGASLVANPAGCTCTNSVHAVRMKQGHRFSQLKESWSHPLTSLSCEIEGHPLGGGMLKLEPREAIRILIPRPTLQLTRTELQELRDARAILRQWRHYE